MGAEEVKQFFQKSFGKPPTRVVRAPGRLELLGNHTDYNGGLVMALAVDKYIYIAASPRNDGIVHPADSRTVLGLALSAAHSNVVRGATEYGVWRH